MTLHKKHSDEIIKETHKQVVKNMSHELRTPLSGIEHALFLLKKTKLTSLQLSYLEIGETALIQLSKQLDKLVALKEMEHITINESIFNLENQLIEVISFYLTEAKVKNIHFEWHYDYDINHLIKTDFFKLKSIIRHLLDNSFKFINQGTISLKIRKINQESISFTITDTGIGMDQETLNHINEPFSQKDISDQRDYQGLGLGLTISKAYIEALGGKLHMESKLNEGTTISFEIRMKEDQPLLFKDADHYHIQTYFKVLKDQFIQSIGFKENDNSSPDFIFMDDETIKDIKDIKDTHGDQKTKYIWLTQTNHKKPHDIDLMILYPTSRQALFEFIFKHDEIKDSEQDYQPMLSGYALIVDDNRLNRIALASILMKQGIQSKTVESGELAIDAVKHESFDIILMDVQMPKMDGMEATRRIRALGKPYQKIPIIAVTANAYFNDYDLLKTSQMTDVIFKPIKHESLNPLLRKYLKPSSEIMIPENLYIFDENEFKSRFSGSLDIAKEVIETFMLEYPKDLKKIEESILIKHAENIIKHVHYYKGSCSYLSAQRLVWLINLMMDHAKHKNLEFMDALFKQLLSETKKLTDALTLFTKVVS